MNENEKMFSYSNILAIRLILVGCGKSPEESLNERATEWDTLLPTLETMTDEEAIKRVEDYLEPSATGSERAKEFYIDWTDVERD